VKPHRNRGLFSNYYLDELLPREVEFKVSISEVSDIFLRRSKRFGIKAGLRQLMRINLGSTF
jgi:hypothetical protein